MPNLTQERSAVLALIAPLTLVGGWFVLGANTNFLAGAFGLASFAAVLAILTLSPPEANIWRALRLPLSFFALALIWAALPVIIPFDMFPADRLATDSIAPRWIGQAAAVAWFAGGAAMGARPGVGRSAVRLIVILGLLWMAISVALRAAGISYVALWGPVSQYSHFALTLRNANTAGTILAMLSVLACGEFLALAIRFGDPMHTADRHAALKLALTLAAFSACAGAIAITGSRMALVLAGLGVLVLVARRGGQLWRHGAIVALPALGVLIVPPMLLLLLLGGSVLRKFHGLAGDFNLRVTDMANFVALSLQKPWFGVGLGNFGLANLSSLTPEDALHRWNFGAAHNVLLNAAIEGGWPYALFAAAGVVTAAIPIFSLRDRVAYDVRMVALCTAVVIGIAAGLIDIALDVPAMLAFVAWLGGIALSRAIRARTRMVDWRARDREGEAQSPYTQAYPLPH
ncbi:O-antigen ligase family protein [Stakelama pacifica]|uniref:O-antigen ligase-like membrane protein n=1 Tax=Stakelama pacifica TaxID=517720 RepID=A0A4R6FIW7_9SPHN|nr:O-antigen ligase family protein [Stakelama pacifica]MAX00922.1 hypothetical protein [Sphingomonas sp.]TDN81207.1 O-antigen ligase-like membrane protein [Stakelama pacifica]GGO97072.1 hypothetical protein GCM10011329_25060 [Stakelama pacifica]